MGSVAELVVRIVADTSGLESGIKQAEGDTSNLSKSAGKMGTGIASGFMSGAKAALGFAGSLAAMAGIGLSVQGVTSAIQSTISAAEGAQNAMAQTNAVLKSTHDVSGQSAQSIANFADQQMRLTGIDDQSIQAAENMVATFTNIKGNVFPQATQAIENMATAMNSGAIPSADQLRQTAIQVGKALNDPVQGVTALQRVGVKLSQSQMDLVKHLVAVGDTAGAQKVILGELNNEFGGAAQAASSTFSGQLAIAQGMLQNVQETIGGAVLPVLTQLLQSVMPIVSAFADALPGAIKTVQHALGGLNLTGFIAPAAGLIQSNLLPTLQRLGGFVMSTLLPAVMQLAQWFMANVLPVLGQVASIIIGTVVPAAMGLVKTLMGQLIPSVMQLWQFIEPQLIPALQFVGGVLTNVVVPAFVGLLGIVASVLNFITSHQAVLQALEVTLGVVGVVILASLVPAFITWAITAGGAAIATLALTWPILAVIAVIALLALGIIELVKHWSDISAFFGKIASAVGTFVGNAFSALGTFFKNMLNSLTSWASGMWQKWENFNAMIAGAVLALIGAVVGYFAGLPGKIGATLDTLRSLAAGKIADLKSAFQNGLADIAGFFAHIALAFPHIKLPHFTISGNFNLNPPSIPTFGVNWYAQGGVFTSPSIIGVGEAGPEAVIPLSRAGGAGVGGNGYQGPDSIELVIDGNKLARILMPHIVNNIRTAAGIRTI